MDAMKTETGRQQKSIKNKFYETEILILFVIKDAPDHFENVTDEMKKHVKMIFIRKWHYIISHIL